MSMQPFEPSSLPRDMMIPLMNRHSLPKDYYIPFEGINGYYWEWNHTIRAYVLRWSPIQGEYSPPLLTRGIQCRIIPYKTNNSNIPISVLIGKDGYHFKQISKLSNTPYIFYVKSAQLIEFWGFPACIDHAIQLFNKHIKHWEQKKQISNT